MAYPTVAQADRRGVYPVIARRGSKYVVLTSTSESDPMSLAQAQVQISHFRRPRTTRKSQSRNGWNFFAGV